MSKLVRTVSYFDKQTETMVGEHLLAGINPPALQSLFGVESDDPMYDVWPNGPREAEILKPHVDGTIDLDRYDYFLDCMSVPETVPDVRDATAPMLTR